MELIDVEKYLLSRLKSTQWVYDNWKRDNTKTDIDTNSALLYGRIKAYEEILTYIYPYITKTPIKKKKGGYY